MQFRQAVSLWLALLLPPQNRIICSASRLFFLASLPGCMAIKGVNCWLPYPCLIFRYSFHRDVYVSILLATSSTPCRSSWGGICTLHRTQPPVIFWGRCPLSGTSHRFGVPLYYLRGFTDPPRVLFILVCCMSFQGWVVIQMEQWKSGHTAQAR